MEVEEVGDVDVGDAERVWLTNVTARRVVVNFDALDLEKKLFRIRIKKILTPEFGNRNDIEQFFRR